MNNNEEVVDLIGPGKEFGEKLHLAHVRRKQELPTLNKEKQQEFYNRILAKLPSEVQAVRAMGEIPKFDKLLELDDYRNMGVNLVYTYWKNGYLNTVEAMYLIDEFMCLKEIPK